MRLIGFVLIVGLQCYSFAASSIVDAAKAKVGTSTRNIPGTSGGRLACVAAVQLILRESVGVVGGGTYSTSAIAVALERSPEWKQVRLADISPGDIIVCPTGKWRGHIGIYVGNAIIHNSSRRRLIRSEPITPAEFACRYGYNKNLKTLVFRYQKLK